MKGIMLEIPLLLLAAYLWLYWKWLERRGRRSPFNEPTLRPPAHSAGLSLLNTTFDLLFYIVGVGAGPFFFTAFMSQSYVVNRIIAVFGVMFVAFCFVQSIKLSKKVIRQHLGVDAELATGSELNLLMRDGAWVFHDIPYQYGNIDHVVIGPGGVFTVETKGISKPVDRSRPGSENATLNVENGVLHLPHMTIRAPIDQAKRHAKWIRHEVQRRYGIAAPVRAVVALPGWMIHGGFDGDCWVINPKRGNALRGAVTKTILSSEHVQTIAAWIEDLARSVEAKSKEFDPKRQLTKSRRNEISE